MAEAESRQCRVTAVHHDVSGIADTDRLLEYAAGAQLLVVGFGAAGIDVRVFGSTSGRGARRRSCPIVVVHGRRRPIRHIAVGVDRSNAGAAALDWAIDEADLHAASLTVLHAWQSPPGPDGSMRRADAQCVVDGALAHVRRRTTRPVRALLVDGTASSALTMQSAHSDLLVIGSRGRSGFKTMLFGSVAVAMARDSSCPVVLVHPQLRAASLR